MRVRRIGYELYFFDSEYVMWAVILRPASSTRGIGLAPFNDCRSEVKEQVRPCQL
jgi:hypothetical protein